ncbi:hypothetical protein [Nostoc sp. UHCC 0252]|uniref:hypothetical protein n=1 Tax=Nostoc sp. UHCC 0252 TaxID=3110241 RepID=UPI002B2130DA|nr:hypothetical protein [Nostoc sp. UHCC 0252]MEA5604203.1 hypothetical protein [Nostoc sp. UHCC 0252]
MSKRLGGYYPPLFFAYQNESNSDRYLAISTVGLRVATLPRKLFKISKNCSNIPQALTIFTYI